MHFAFAATTAAVEGKMSKTLKKMLKKLVVKEAQETLAVADAKLGNAIKVCKTCYIMILLVNFNVLTHLFVFVGQV